MDFLTTRKFISELKRIREELYALNKSFLSLRQDFQDQTEAARNAKETNDASKIPDVMIATLPHGVEVQKSAKDKRDEQKDQNRLLRIQKLTLFVVSLYTGFAALQWIETIRVTKATEQSANAAHISAMAAQSSAYAAKESNGINREALYAVQRPFVIFKEVKSQTVTIDQNSERYIRVVAIWENSGNTVATKCVHFFSVDGRDKPPEENIFKEGSQPNLSDVVKGPIGPKSTLITDIPPVKESDFVTIRGTANRLKMYFFGWIVYRDLFPNTPIHLTEFCQVRRAVLRDPKTNNIALDMTDCRDHNCTDNTCSDYSEMIKYASSLSAR